MCKTKELLTEYHYQMFVHCIISNRRSKFESHYNHQGNLWSVASYKTRRSILDSEGMIENISSERSMRPLCELAENSLSALRMV